MAPQPPLPAPPPLSTHRPAFERAPLGSGPKRPPTPPGGGRPRPPARRGGGLLLGIVYFFLFVLLAGGGAIGYLVLNPPSDLIRQKIAEQVKAKTGRDLVMAGPASFMFYPVLGVSLGDVSLSDPPGMDGTLVRMEALDVSVKALTLLSQQIEINSVVLRKPVFDFRIDKDGRNNWEFAEAASPARFAELLTPGTRRDVEPVKIAAADDDSSPNDSRDVFPPAEHARTGDVQLDHVRLEDGTLRFTDDRSGKTSEVSAVNVKLALPSLDSPLVAKGNLAWHDQRIDFDGKLTDVENAFSKRPAHLAFNAKNPLITASYDGGILIKSGVFLEGQVTSQSDSARALAEWSGIKLPPVSGFGPLSIQGTLKTGGHVTNFSNAEFGLDGASAKGTIKVTTGGTRPFVDADLAVSELDLNKYLTSAVTGVLATEGGQPSNDAGDANPPPAPALKPGAEDGAAEPDAIEHLLNQPNPPASKVYGAVQRAGWSSEKLNLALLNVADGNAHLNVGKLRFKNVAIGQSAVAVAVKDRAMTATFEDVELYQGRGKGTVTVDGSADTANIAANLDLDNVAALPFLRDAANFEWIAGNARVGLQLAANGASQLQLIESLNGKADFKFADGAIVGFNLPGAVRGLANGDFSGLRKAPSEKTDFSALSASFAIANGIAENKDLQLVSPLLRITGAGTIHMPERTVDYTVKPKVVASLEGQEGSAEGAAAGGIEVPVRISGSWDKPKYQADLKGVLSDPGKTVETIKEIGKKFKGKSANQIVDQLFGKKDGDDSSTANAKAKAKNFLNKFFGKDDSAAPADPPSEPPTDKSTSQ